jgi:hypothetical protein
MHYIYCTREHIKGYVSNAKNLGRSTSTSLGGRGESAATKMSLYSVFLECTFTADGVDCIP